MKLERYNIHASEAMIEFEFISSGIKGDIVKVVQYSPTGILNTYNLAFGDKAPETGEISDSVVTDNGDSQKVLATVAETTLMFLKKHPKAQVFAIGLSASRTRLYQRGIANNLEEINEMLDVKGVCKRPLGAI
ncbi:MAG: hypothetical protein K1X56_07475 [Flavobacteriales bacterium]|nr:hypothetical protein [Flavobacteriales bacterium]